MSRPRRLLRALGIDRAVGYTILLQAFALVSRPLLLAAMVACLTVAEQGYQYTILGLLGLKALFEFGVGIALMHVVGRDGSRVTVRAGQPVSGEPAALDRVASLVRKTVFGYAVIAALFVAVVLPVGGSILGSAHDADIRWEWAWVVAVAATAAGFPIHGAFNVLIGTGNMPAILRMRLWVGVIQAAVYGGLLWAGFGLTAAPLGLAAAAALELAWLVLAFGRPLRGLWRHPVGSRGVNWRREVLPLQWRVAVSWLGNYLLSQALIPLAFRYCGEAEAGRLGLTLAVVGLLHGFAFGWVATKLPGYAARVGEGRVPEMRAAFARDVRYALAVYLFGAVVALGGVLVVTVLRPSLAERVLPAEWLAVALAAGGCWLLVECVGNVLNTFHKDPLMPVRIAVAAATLGGGWVFADAGGTPAMVAIMCACSLLSACSAVFVYRKFMAGPLAVAVPA